MLSGEQMGWGAVCSKGNMNGRWAQEESQMHINVLEMKAVYFALRCFAKEKGLTVRVLSDNSTTVSYINKKGGMHSPQCLLVSQQIRDWVESLDQKLIAAHIPGKAPTR